MRRRPLLGALLAAAPSAFAQLTPPISFDEAPSGVAAAALTQYVVPGGTSYLLPILFLDDDYLHIEGRYNYEGMQTGSFFIGKNMLSAGGSVHVVATPMFGAVFGPGAGFAPALEITLTTGRFLLAAEGEYVFRYDGNTDDSFFSWSQLTYAVGGGWSAGLTAQRLRPRPEGRNVDAGPILAWRPKYIGGALMAYDPFSADAFYAIGFNIAY